MPCNCLLYRQSVAFIIFLILGTGVKGQPRFLITQQNAVVNIHPSHLQWQTDSSDDATIPGQSVLNKSKQARSNPDNVSGTGHGTWSSFILVNKTATDKEYLIQTKKTGVVMAWIKHSSDSGWKVLRSGSLLKLKDRSLPSNTNGIIIQVYKNDPLAVILKFKSGYSIYEANDHALTLQPLALFERKDSQRLLWQGWFLGIMFVMAFYNFIIFFAVKDVSYLYYVLSIIGIGLYFSFYYGIAIEYLWPAAPLWDTYCFMLIVPFNGLTRILLTKTYLHTSRILPRTNRVLSILAWLCVLLMAAGFCCYLFKIDVLQTAIDVVGVLGTIILFMMLYSGLAAFYKEGYKPARYFIYANILLVIGGTLFISREMRLVPDNFLTQYFVQAGTLIQVILFALGLASRLNDTRTQLAQEIVEKERLALERETEKKELFEKQKKELQLQVDQQTADLQKQNHLLEDIIAQLKTSEYKLTQLNDLKDKLFSIISHDLRNPLATMQSTIKLLTEHHSKLDEEEKKQLSQEAQSSLDNLNQLLYNLLQWSRSQMNLLQFRKERFAIQPVLISCVKILQLNAHIKNIKMHVVAEGTLWGHADKDMIEFVIRNLLSNAIKFSYRDSDVYIKATAHDEQIKIQVLDSGIGLSTTRIHSLLHLNGSLSRRGTEKEKGTGLGLLICKDFIQKNGGTLHIESEPGKGSCFWFLIEKFKTVDC